MKTSRKSEEIEDKLLKDEKKINISFCKPSSNTLTVFTFKMAVSVFQIYFTSWSS